MVTWPEWSWRALRRARSSCAAAPAAFARAAFEFGYYIQAPWYLDAVEAIDGNRPERFWFVVQETSPPYIVQVYTLDFRAMEWGARQGRRAIDLFAKCLSSGRWPTYGDGAQEISLPTYTEYQLQGSDLPAAPSAETLRIAEAAQAPLAQRRDQARMPS